MQTTRNLARILRIKKSIRFSSTSTQEEIIVPNRIERGPTDILKALASTVGTDYTAPNYRYHDDPLLIPYHNQAKREYALSKQSGKEAARFILENHAVLFERNRITAEPPITAFQPRSQYNESNVSIELLENMICSFQVEDSLAVYDLLKNKKKKIPEKTLQSLLELSAFYAEENASDEDDGPTRGMLPNRMAWQTGGVAEQIYSQLSNREARLAMLVGLARHGENTRALQVWEECRAAGDQLPVEAFNAYLSVLEATEVDRFMDTVKIVLSQMVEAKVRPNPETLVSILKSLATLVGSKKGGNPVNYEASCQCSLALLAEFRAANIPICAGAYTYLMDIFLPFGKKSGILADILSELEGKDLWPAQSVDDLKLFPRMMQVANYLDSAKLAYQVHELLLKGENINLQTDFRTANFYYQNFLSVVLRHEKFPVFMELYNKLTPHIWSPTRDFLQRLLTELNAQGAVNYIGKIYDDLILGRFGGGNKEVQHAMSLTVLKILEAHPPSKSEFENLSATWVDVTKRIFKFLTENIASKALYLRFNTYAADICSYSIKILLREDKVEESFNVLDFCTEEKERMPGHLTEEVVEALFEVASKEQNLDRVIQVIDYCLDTSPKLSLKLAMDLVQDKQRLQLSDSAKERLNKMFAAETRWTTL